MPSLIFDIAIIGAGASGLQLLYESIQADSNREKKILLIDSGDRSKKSWCFWEDQQRKCFPFLVEKSWKSMTYRSSKGATISSEISPLTYNYISSDRFFSYFFDEFIPNDPRITLVQNRAINLHESSDLQSIECEDGSIFYAKQIADSRPIKIEEKYPIYQHFCGKFIEFENPILDESAMTLMDFSLPISNKDMAVFHYILPFSQTTALIETTVFSHLPFNREAYEDIWNKYMDTNYHSHKFRIISDELGTIPMSIPNKRAVGKIFKIGAAGGMIKASTGYAFTKMHNDAILNANNESNRTPSRFRFYDKMLLRIMQREMNKVPEVMDRLFRKVPQKDILYFLDDKTSLWQDIQLLSKLDIPLFFKHLIR